MTTDADRLERERQVERERAVEAARREAGDRARAEVRAETAGKLVRAAAQAVAGDRVPADKLAAVLDRVDPVKFLTESGDIDELELGRFVAAVAGEDLPAKRRRFPNLGQGRRGDGSPAEASVETGRERYRSRPGARAGATRGGAR